MPTNSVADDVTIEIGEAIEIAQELAASRFGCLSDKLLNDFVGILSYMAGDRNTVFVSELVNAIENFGRAILEGDASMLAQPRGLRTSRIVDVQEFVESKFFMGQRGYVRPKVLEKLWELFHGENAENHLEVVLGGGIGWGKSFFGEMSLGYMLYKLSCYHCPQMEFGLAPGSSIYFVTQSVKEDLAKKVLFGQFSHRLRRSEYFSKFFPYDPNVLSELRFPNDISIIPRSSSDTSALGLNVFGGCFPGTQEYLLGDGTLAKLGECRTENVLTVERPELFGSTYVANQVESIPTGYKELVRLHLSNGETMDCTPDQRFKVRNGEWVRADELAGADLLFANVPTVRSSSDLFGPASQIGAQRYDRSGLSEDVPGRTTVWEETSGYEVDGGQNGHLPDMQSENWHDKCQPSKISRHNSCRVSSTVSNCRCDSSIREEAVVGEIEEARCQSAKESEVCGIAAEGNVKGVSFGPRSPAESVHRPEIYSSTFQERKRPIRFDDNATEEASVRDVSCWEDAREAFTKEHCFVHGQKRQGVQNVIQAGMSDSILDGQSRDRLGVRDGKDSVHGRSSSLHSRLCTAESRCICGEQRSVACRQRQPLDGQAECCCRKTGVVYGCRSGEAVIESCEELAFSHEGAGDRLQDHAVQIRVVTCDSVERLGVVAPVFDLKHVPDTHTFFVKAGSGFLLAHNCLDELNFMSRVIRPSSSRFTGEQEYDQAEKLYSTIVRRMKSRFNVKGQVPGKLILISSANYPGDFIDRKMQEQEAEIAAEGRSSIFVVKMAQWESLPPDRLSEEKFLVEVGDATRSSRIIESMEEAVDPESVIEVPVDYKSDFKTDLESALRDLAGIPIGGTGAFIKRRELIEKAAKTHEELFDGRQLFSRSVVDLTNFSGDLIELIDSEYMSNLLASNNPLFAHVDLALTGDSCGLALGHFGGFAAVGKTTNWDEERNCYVESPAGEEPVAIIDGVLEIIPPKVDEIDINIVGDLLEVINSRLLLEIVTADSFQSAAFLQRMRKIRNLRGRRVRSGMLSVDTSIAPYSEVKQALRDSRLIYPNVEKLKKELRELNLDPRAKKVDHPVGGSKDLADAAASVTYLVLRRNSNKTLKGAAGRKILAGLDAPEEAVQEQTSRPTGSGRRLH